MKDTCLNFMNNGEETIERPYGTYVSASMLYTALPYGVTNRTCLRHLEQNI